MIHLVTGGARAGKSTYALRLAEAREGTLAFIATAERSDDEMRLRIDRHQAERGPRWHTWEAPITIELALQEAAAAHPTVVLDCLTVWMANEVYASEDDEVVEARITAVCACLRTLEATVYVVSNEVGLGIVPDNALARRYRDLLGRCNQRVASLADEVSFVVAGLPLKLK